MAQREALRAQLRLEIGPGDAGLEARELGHGVEVQQMQYLDHHVLPAIRLGPVTIGAVERMWLEFAGAQRHEL